MEKGNFNKYLSIGVIIFAIRPLLMGSSIQLPCFINGLILGTGFSFTLIGIYSINHDISKLKNQKLFFIKKCFNK
ncbi:hypothetical protein G9F72_022605 [Clostridium estertheticum]|uniref:hypothetical protein n=1 Tax=Clostridium estertheticum TaxID=238834 RepID=UPI0013E9513D|nr:hypothetical protein [Clostridium estertheticum]MBZ9689093.1 hypothetical protein [Clostridium estertheticum]